MRPCTALLNVYLTSRNTIFHLADAPACFLLSSYHTSICSIELNAKVSIRSSRVVAGSEDDATDGFVFPDHTRDGRCGHYPVVSNDQTTHLRKCHTGVCMSWLAGVCSLIYLSGGGEGKPLNIRFGVSCFFLKVTATDSYRYIGSKFYYA